MSITFSEPKPKAAPSLAYRLGVEGCIRFRTMTSGITLTYEDNEAELVPLWVAEKPRTAVIEVTEPEYELGSRFKVVFGV